MPNVITPFIKRLRVSGGTIYTFNSSIEDIGLNINEQQNVVKISNFALLNIPPINSPSNTQENRFNVFAINGAFDSYLSRNSVLDARVMIAESFQNYALNLESNLLNNNTYNPNLFTTVSERVFWKWLKETGAIRWQVDPSSGYWVEEFNTESSTGYNSVVKYIGQISAGNIQQSNYGTQNETYVLIPTSHGETNAYFKQIVDDNYYPSLIIPNGNANILGRESYTGIQPDALSYSAFYDIGESSINTYPVTSYNMYYDNSTGGNRHGWWPNGENLNPPVNSYITDSSSYMISKIYNQKLSYIGPTTISFKRSNVDCLSLELDINNLMNIYNDPNLTFDSIATAYSTNSSFQFNAMLIYYTIYDKTLQNNLATNLLGVLFLDPPSGNSANYQINDIVIPSLQKLQSGPTGFGTSYSFRINIKSDNIIDDTQAMIVDYSTSDQTMLEDYTSVLQNLATSVSILNQNTQTIEYIAEQYEQISQNENNIVNQINDLSNQVNEIDVDLTGNANTIVMFTGSNITNNDPITESSIYMLNGNVGIGTNTPQSMLDINGSLNISGDLMFKSGKDAHISMLQSNASTNTIYIYGQNAGASGLKNNGGNLMIKAGKGFGNALSGKGGSVTIHGGLAGNGADLSPIGGDVSIKAGDVSISTIGANAIAGNLYLSGGNITSTQGNGGNIYIRGGYGNSIVKNGFVEIDSSLIINSNILNNGNLTTNGFNLNGNTLQSSLVPNINNSYNLGSSTLQFHDIYSDDIIYSDLLQMGGNIQFEIGSDRLITFMPSSSSTNTLEIIGQTAGAGISGNSGGNVLIKGGTGVAHVLSASGGSVSIFGGISGSGGSGMSSGGDVSIMGGYTNTQVNIGGNVHICGGIGYDKYRNGTVYIDSSLVIEGGVYMGSNLTVMGVFSNPSDKRLKRNIKKITGSTLDRILKLDGVTYNTLRSEELRSGFIAQDVKEYIPEVVKNISIEGTLESSLYMGISYIEMIPYLVESIKELNNKIIRIEKKLRLN